MRNSAAEEAGMSPCGLVCLSCPGGSHTSGCPSHLAQVQAQTGTQEMFVDDGRKEDTRGAGRQLPLRDWVPLYLTWVSICRTVLAEQDGSSKDQGRLHPEKELIRGLGGAGLISQLSQACS